MMDLPLVERAEAMKKPSAHAFYPGIGYVRLGAQPMPKNPPKGTAGRCAPPAKVSDGSRHYLMPPGASRAMLFAWHAGEKVWTCPNGNRMGFSPDYLAAQGWVYESAA